MIEPITEAWLREVGFKWHQLERQPDKHWLLWIGGCCGKHMDYEDLGIELAATTTDGEWHCWIRADTSSWYSRFLHVRYVRTCADVARLFEGLTGCSWDPRNHFGGSARKPEHAEAIRRESQRLDQQMLRERSWRSIEKDGSRGGALPEHLQAHEEAKGRA